MSNRRTTIKTTATKKRPRRHLLVVYGAMICFAVILLIVGQSKIGSRDEHSPRNPNPRATQQIATAHRQTRKNPDGTTAANSGRQAADPALVDDDGKTLWVSPTDGRPIDVAYLPPGVMFVLSMRPEAIAEHPEGDKILDAVGPSGIRGLEFLSSDLPSIAGVTLDVIGFSVDTSGNWSVTQVVQISGGQTAIEYMRSRLPDAVQKSRNGTNYWLNGNRAYYAPKHDGELLVVTTPDAIIEIIDLGNDPPPLRRDVERMLAHTDADRHVTILFAPNSLFREGRSIFDGPMAPLREALDWFLGDNLSAAALSLHWDQNFYFELLAMPTLDTSPERAARILAERVREIPDKLEAYVVGLEPEPYGRMVIARFPAMVRKLSAYTRSGFDKDCAVLNGYLPAVAGHNLLMGAELTLAEVAGEARTVAEATSPSTEIPERVKSIREKLRRRTSLRFARETLEAALEQLSQDIGVPIVIRGADLQADGITKNQSFGIDVQGKPAEEILVEILRLANPDKTAVGTNDVKQKLVYVIGPGEGGVEQILVTTRASAASRGDELPDVFRAAGP